MVATRQSWETSTTTDTAVVTTAETVVLTLRNINASLGRHLFDLAGYVDATTGVGTTAVVLRVRRGTGIGDPLVGEATTTTIGAGVLASFDLVVTDDLEGAAGQPYVLTVSQTAATGNGTVRQAALRCDSRSG